MHPRWRRASGLYGRLGGLPSGLAGPTHRPVGLLLSPFALPHPGLLPDIYTVDFKVVLGRFIQRWLTELTQIDDMAVPYPLLHLPYIRRPLPPLGEPS